jgi:hypothetical protein
LDVYRLAIVGYVAWVNGKTADADRRRYFEIAKRNSGLRRK